MDELISKRAVCEAIENNDNFVGGSYDIIKVVKNLPPAEPQIIRCKDCKYREYYRESGYMCALDTGDPYMTGRNAEDDDWFCADAERKDDE